VGATSARHEAAGGCRTSGAARHPDHDARRAPRRGALRYPDTPWNASAPAIRPGRWWWRGGRVRRTAVARL